MRINQLPAILALALAFLAPDLKSVTATSPIEETPIPTVKLCDLLRTPGKFKNKIVRVRADYRSWFEGSELMADCSDSCVWAYFPDDVYQKSKPDIAEKLEDAFGREIVDNHGKPNSRFSSWQTDLLLTGKLEFSKKKNYGMHGGCGYLFIVSTVEEIGITRIHDYETGQTTDYVSESSSDRQARHAREAESVCESNSLYLNKVITEMKSPQERISLVGSLGANERSSTVNQLRLMTIRNYFVDCVGISADRVTVREGERSRFEGRVNVYRDNELSKILLAAKEMNNCLRPCQPAAKQSAGADSP